ncbi:MAG: response regulator transcription factor [Chloroflexi bacterium]|nr:response regulator transcription factor [Chloroflexota bacterium]
MCQQAPTTRLVMLSIYATFHGQALAAGACVSRLKDCGRDELEAAIRLAAHGPCQANRDERPGP